MNHHDHVSLLRDGVPATGGVWADLGSGTGAFTLALAELLGATGEIYSLDRDASALRTQARAMHEHFPDVTIHYQQHDFAKPIQLPALDGIVMANSLHFIREKEPVLRLVKNYLKPNGRLILVEYNVDAGNWAVPFPLSFPTWQSLASRVGFTTTRLLATRPSHFLREIYSAASW